MISGAGMLDFESCQSLEKLVMDAEIISMARRVRPGDRAARGSDGARPSCAAWGTRRTTSPTPHTLRWFREELVVPSAGHRPRIARRVAREGTQTRGPPGARSRARAARNLRRPPRPESVLAELRAITTRAARQCGARRAAAPRLTAAVPDPPGRLEPPGANFSLAVRDTVPPDRCRRRAVTRTRRSR